MKGEENDYHIIFFVFILIAKNNRHNEKEKTPYSDYSHYMIAIQFLTTEYKRNNKI